MPPPSVILKEKFSKQVATSTASCPDLAKKVLLSEEETKIWLDHLAIVLENRKRGAAKAAQKKSNVNNENETYCGVCKLEYSKSKSDFWICCDLCDVWYCSSCEHLTSEPETDKIYLCKKCCK